MDRLKNVKKYLELYRWKLDRAGYTEDIEWAIEEIEQGMKEKEWLMELLYEKLVGTPIPIKVYKRSIIDMMQQDLKKK